MIDSARLKARMAECGLSQSELARRIGITQSSIYGITSGKVYGSTHLHKIARELATTPAYLTGETDDPDENAPPPPPAPVVQHIMMPVALPSEAALTRMFEGLLASMPGLLGAELARELATLLPTALGTVRGPLVEIQPDRSAASPARTEGDDAARPARRRASRT